MQMAMEIIDEYEEIFVRLNKKYKTADPLVLTAILRQMKMFDAQALPKQVCDDIDDDKFLACVEASNASYIVSGDRLLLEVKEFFNCQIDTVSHFLGTYW